LKEELNPAKEYVLNLCYSFRETQVWGDKEEEVKTPLLGQLVWEGYFYFGLGGLFLFSFSSLKESHRTF